MMIAKRKKAGSPVVAIDIGGTKILCALFSATGQMLDRDTLPTLAGEGVDAVVGRVGAAIDNVLKQSGLEPARLGAIGIACAGGIDTGRGVVVTPSPNLPGWVDIPLADIIRKRFGTRTYLVNDASAAALGEHRFGVGRGVKHLVLLTLGTGIGGGIIAEGRLYLGAVGAAGELGHMTIEADGPECTCGNRGCLEKLASGTAVAGEAQKRLRRGEKSVLSEMAGGEVEKVTAEMVEVAARRGDTLAGEVVARAAYYLGVGMANIVNIFNPEMVVLGGGMARMGDLLIEPARHVMVERAFPIASRVVRVSVAQLGNEAGVYGAAAFVLDRLEGGINEGT
jgi:glucokinase